MDNQIENPDKEIKKAKEYTETLKLSKILQTRYNKLLKKLAHTGIENNMDSSVSQQTTQSNQLQNSSQVTGINSVKIPELTPLISYKNPFSFLNSFPSEQDISKAVQKATEQYAIDTNDTEALVKDGISITEKHPEITEKDLAVKLLEKLANNKKTTKIGKLAREMLEEKWWEK